MGRYVVKRLILALFSVTIILSLTFILMKMLPFDKPIGTDPVKYGFYMDQVHKGFVMYTYTETPELGEYLFKYQLDGRWHYFYEVPVMDQYVSWVKNIVTKWDWGVSTQISPNKFATVIMGEALPYTIKINILSVIFSVPLGIILGIIAALKKNTKVDHAISTGIMVFISIPGYIIIVLLILLLGYKLQWVPTQWPSSEDPIKEQILGYIIPVICLSFGSVCGYARFTRAELCEVMESDYLLLARTKGLTRKQAIIRHALRNAMVPIVPSILAEVIGLLGGSMVLEQLYGIPGIGRLFLTALNMKDYSVLFVDMAIFTTIGLLSGVVLDLSYGFIDPRIRMGAKK